VNHVEQQTPMVKNRTDCEHHHHQGAPRLGRKKQTRGLAEEVTDKADPLIVRGAQVA